MKIIDKAFKIKNYKIDILLTHIPRFWKELEFKIRRTVVFENGKMLNILFLGFQFRIIIGKEYKTISIQEFKQKIWN